MHPHFLLVVCLQLKKQSLLANELGMYIGEVLLQLMGFHRIIAERFVANDALWQLFIRSLHKREAVVQLIDVVLSFRHLDFWDMYLREKEEIIKQ